VLTDGVPLSLLEHQRSERDDLLHLVVVCVAERVADDRHVAPVAFLLGLGRGEDLDAVRGRELGEQGRIGRDGLGQPQGLSGLARGGDELVEPAW
jgi:hypothetical protein